MLNPWKWGTIGFGIALAVSLAWGVRVDHVRSGWVDKWTTLDGQSQSVLIATRQAANNPQLKWAGVPDQITALASSNQDLKKAIDVSNSKVLALNADYLKLKAQGDEYRAQITLAQRDRATFAAKLAAMAVAPGDRASCPALLSQTQDALDLAWSSGQ